MNEPFKSVLQHLTKTGELPVTPKPPVDLTSTDPRLNLDRLATYLEALPADYADFEMRTFVQGVDRDKLMVYAERNGSVSSCGTAACAVGHGPAAHMFFNAEELETIRSNSMGLAWFQYAERVFGVGPHSNEFDFLFGGSWTYSDNTVHGAAKRIRYYLAHGVPEDFSIFSDYDEMVALYNA